MTDPLLPAPPSDREQGAGPVSAGTIAILLTSIALATAGQLLLKAGMNRIGAELSLSDLGPLIAGAVTTWQVLAGLTAFGLSAVFWLLTLSRVPLSTAYPMVSLSYVLILLFSTIVLDERPGPLVWAGALLIMTGITFVGVGQR